MTLLEKAILAHKMGVHEEWCALLDSTEKEELDRQLESALHRLVGEISDVGLQFAKFGQTIAEGLSTGLEKSQ